jgi:hypothetical protein
MMDETRAFKRFPGGILIRGEDGIPALVAEDRHPRPCKMVVSRSTCGVGDNCVLEVDVEMPTAGQGRASFHLGIGGRDALLDVALWTAGAARATEPAEDTAELPIGHRPTGEGVTWLWDRPKDRPTLGIRRCAMDHGHCHGVWISTPAALPGGTVKHTHLMMVDALQLASAIMNAAVWAEGS